MSKMNGLKNVFTKQLIFGYQKSFKEKFDSDIFRKS